MKRGANSVPLKTETVVTGSDNFVKRAVQGSCHADMGEDLLCRFNLRQPISARPIAS